MLRNAHLLLLPLIVLGCGDDAEPVPVPPIAETATPATAEPAPPTPAPGEQPAGEPAAEATPEGGGPWVVGGGEGGLSITDMANGAVARRGVGDVASARWVACGARIAYHTPAGRVHVIEQNGTEVASIAIPNMIRSHGDRLAERVARVWQSSAEDEVVAEVSEIIENLRSADELDGLVKPGELSRTQSGRLAMDPRVDLSMLHGEEEGCEPLARRMRVQLRVDGVEPSDPDAECTYVERSVVRMPRHAEDRMPAGWGCRAHEPSTSDPAWAAVHSGTARIRGGGASFSLQHQQVEKVIICTPPDDPSRRTVAPVVEASMGCSGAPPLFVVREGTVEADLGSDGKVRQYGDVRLYGGRTRWVAQVGDGPLREVGSFEPDVSTHPFR